MKQFSLKKLLAVILSVMMIMTVMPMAIFAAEDTSDRADDGYAAAQLFVEDDSIALKITLWWAYDYYDGSNWCPNLAVVIPNAIAKYNENHATEYDKDDINKIIVVGEPGGPASLNPFISFLRNNGYAENLVELDLSQSYFRAWSWNSDDLETGLFTNAGGASYFPKLKVLKLSSTSFTKIQYAAFNNMTALETIELPSGLKIIEPNAFEGCTALKTVAFPDTVTSIGANAFNKCTAVTSWSFHGSNDGAVAIISQMNDFTNYTSVDLSGSDVTASTVLGLKDTITYLNLTDCANIDYSTADGKTLYAKILRLKDNGAEVYAPENPNYDPYEDLDTVKGDYAEGRFIVEGDFVALKLKLYWKYDYYDGSDLINLTTFIPEVIAKYNENHVAEYTKDDINKIILIGEPSAPSSLNGFIQYLRNNGYAENLVELDLSESYFKTWKEDTNLMLETSVFAEAYGDSYFPNLKVLKLGGTAFTSISYNAFNNMTSLETIELPSALTSIGPGAFENCSSLKSIDFPDTLTGLGDYVFAGCSAIESWSYHGTGACAEAILAQLNEFTSYKKVDLSGSGISTAAALTIKTDVTYLNLKDCSNIEYDSEDGDKLFERLLTLEQNGVEVYYPENPNYDPYEVYDSVENGYVKGRLIVKGDSVALKLQLWWKADQDYGTGLLALDTFIPDAIAKYNENHNAEYTKNDINKIIVIGADYAPSSLNGFIQYLRNNGYADNLVELDLSESYFVQWTWDSPLEIENGLFAEYGGNSYFPNLKVLKLDGTAFTSIAFNAFNNMTSLETITLPNGIEKIDNDAFNGCSSLKAIDFPRYLKSMGVTVFKGCSSLESWSYHGPSMETIAFFGENNLGVTPYTRVDLSGSSVDSATALNLNNSLTYLNLSNCPNIEYESESGKALWSKILKLRANGAEVIAPDNLDFDYDEAMDTVTGGSDDGLWTDDADARIKIEDDTVVLKLHFKWEVQDYVGDWTPQLDKLIPLAVDTYNTNHQTVIDKTDIAKVVVTVSEDGDIDLAFPNFIKFFRDNGYAENLEVLDLSEATFTTDVTEDWDAKVLNNTLFAPYDGATYFPKLTVIKLGASQFTAIEYNAFNNLTALEEIELPANLQKIEGAAFKGCTALKSIALPDSLNSIDRYAFEGCTALDSWSYHGSVAERDDPENFYNDLFVGFRDVQATYTSVDVSGSTVNADNVRRISENATYVNLTDCPNIYIGAKGIAAYAKLKELRANGAEVIAPELIFGDADNDGTVEADDLVALRRVLLKDESLLDENGLNGAACDANDDGEINIIDLVRTKKIVANIA